MKHVRLLNKSKDLLDSKDNLVIDSENSYLENGTVHCHFYLREKTAEESLKERVAFLEEQLSVHDGAIADMGETISSLAEEGGLA